MHLTRFWTFKLLKTFLRVTNVLKLINLLMFLTWTLSWIVTLPRSHFPLGYSHELLLDLVHIFDMDVFMNYYFASFTFLIWRFLWIIITSFTFLTRTFLWIITLPLLLFWHRHCHELLLNLVHIFNMDIFLIYYFTSFIF